MRSIHLGPTAFRAARGEVLHPGICVKRVRGLAQRLARKSDGRRIGICPCASRTARMRAMAVRFTSASRASCQFGRCGSERRAVSIRSWTSARAVCSADAAKGSIVSMVPELIRVNVPLILLGACRARLMTVRPAATLVRCLATALIMGLHARPAQSRPTRRAMEFPRRRSRACGPLARRGQGHALASGRRRVREPVQRFRRARDALQ